MASLTINGKRRKIPWGINDKRMFYYMYQTSAWTRPWQIPFVHGCSPIRQALISRLHGCCVPLALLIDPTSACNLNCIGCYAAGYARGDGLSFGELDSIVTQAERLSIHLFLFTGGEPMVRRTDLLRLAQAHPRSIFNAFTNGTLFDADFADTVARAGNLTFAFSVEGYGEQTDYRRGAGVYERILGAMELLRQRDVAFGFSVCCHAKNYDLVTSDAFAAEMARLGCWGGWYFTYLPVGADATMDLVLSPEQRAHVSRHTRALRDKGYILHDFWYDSFLVGGCIAGGRQYLHINARGDVEPCAFCHYADVNIRQMSLVDALKSPFLRALRKAQPFHENPFRPCPILDNPTCLQKLVEESGARSTEYGTPESAAALCEKMSPIAAAWGPTADALYEGLTEEQRACSAFNMAYYRRHPW